MADRFHLKPNLNGNEISKNIQYNTILLRLRFADVEFQNKKRKKQKSTAKVTSSAFIWTDINMQWHNCQTIWRLRSHALPNRMTNFYEFMKMNSFVHKLNWINFLFILSTAIESYTIKFLQTKFNSSWKMFRVRSMLAQTTVSMCVSFNWRNVCISYWTVSNSSLKISARRFQCACEGKSERGQSQNWKK